MIQCLEVCNLAKLWLSFPAHDAWLPLSSLQPSVADGGASKHGSASSVARRTLK